MEPPGLNKLPLSASKHRLSDDPRVAHLLERLREIISRQPQGHALTFAVDSTEMIYSGTQFEKRAIRFPIQGR